MIPVSPELVGPAVYAFVGHVQSGGSVAPGYIDPGTGSMLIQAALAAALTLPFVLRNKARAIVNRIPRRRTQPLGLGEGKPALR